MEAVFLKLLNMSITASWLVLAVIVLRLLLKKAPKSIAVIMWALVAVRLVCPFSFESVLSLIPSAETIPSYTIYSDTPTIQSGISTINQAVNPVIAQSFEPYNNVGINLVPIITYNASIVWIVGISLMLAYTIISYLVIYKKVREAAHFKGNIWMCDRIDTPFILGVFKPRIYLPSNINEQDIQYVLAHEQAHLKRYDHIWKPLGFLLLTIYWFNPFLWIAYILLCRDIELACDEKVLGTLGHAIKKPYSNALINCSVPRKVIAACPLAFGEIGIKSRIKSVLNYKKPAFWVIVVAITASIILAVCFLTNPQGNHEIFNWDYITDRCLYSYVTEEEKETKNNQLGYNISYDGSVYVFFDIFDNRQHEKIGNLKESDFTSKELNHLLKDQQGKSVHLGRIKATYEISDSNGKKKKVFFLTKRGKVYMVSFFSDGKVMDIFKLVKIRHNSIRRVLYYNKEFNLSDIETMNIGAEMPYLIYGDDNKIIFSGTCGIVVYDLTKLQISDRLSWDSLNELGIDFINAQVSADGNIIYIGDTEKREILYEYILMDRVLLKCYEQPTRLFSYTPFDYDKYNDFLDFKKLNGEWIVERKHDFLFLQADTDWSMKSLQLVICDYDTKQKNVINLFE